MANINDLRLFDIQHQVRHESTDKFKIGERVFLKSNPEVPLIVYRITEKEITVIWNDKLGNTHTWDMPPQCILQYKYAGLVIQCGFEISLN